MTPRLNSLTVGELRNLLSDFDEDMPVVFAYNSGDYWHTTLNGTIQDAEYGHSVYSDYHQKFKQDSGEDDGSVQVVILSS